MVVSRALSRMCGSLLSWPGLSVPTSVRAHLPELRSPGNLGSPPAPGASPGQNWVPITCLCILRTLLRCFPWTAFGQPFTTE